MCYVVNCGFLFFILFLNSLVRSPSLLLFFLGPDRTSREPGTFLLRDYTVSEESVYSSRIVFTVALPTLNSTGKTLWLSGVKVPVSQETILEYHVLTRTNTGIDQPTSEIKKIKHPFCKIRTTVRRDTLYITSEIDSTSVNTVSRWYV